MRTYFFVICLITGLMGAYFALLPATSMSNSNTGLTGVGPG